MGDADEAPAVGRIDQPRIEAAVREILVAIGEDPDRDGLLDTPARVARMYEEIFAGLREDPPSTSSVTFDAGHDEMVMVRDIPLYSTCEHHLVPVHRARPTWPTSPTTTAGSPACPSWPGWSTPTPAGPRSRSG